MSLKARRKVVSSIPPMGGGTYMGVCVAVVDLGRQYKQFEKQKQGKYAEECMFIFEIPDERGEVDAALFQMLTAWRGKALTDAELDPSGDGFDLMQMAGVPAMLSVTVVEKDDGSKYNRIEAVTGFPKGLPAPQPESEILVFDADEPDMEVFGKLPEWVQDIIRKMAVTDRLWEENARQVRSIGGDVLLGQVGLF